MSTISCAGHNLVQVHGLVDLYTSTLEGRGYCATAIQAYRAAVEHFLAWTAPDNSSVEIGEGPIRRFINEHLPVCSCPGRRQRGKVTMLSALRRLLSVVRDSGILLSAQPTFPSYVNAELASYSAYAADVGGLAPATLTSRRQWIGRFLAHLFPAGEIVFSQLGGKAVRDFFTTHCQRYRPGTSQVVASCIRSYFRFRSVRCADAVEALMAAVPSAALWRLATLPKHLSQAELTQLMSAFEHGAPQRQRDYAIVRYLVDLGLRSCEVAALRLEDLDWDNGTVTIRDGKAKRADMLPLPVITGQAIADYLHGARPTTQSRDVFVRHRAPLDVPVNASVVRSVVRQAAARSGLGKRLTGPHCLRHSAATRMLEGGATLKEIADVLRHRSLDTTSIYVKIDRIRLNAITQPWPEGAR